MVKLTAHRSETQVRSLFESLANVNGTTAIKGSCKVKIGTYVVMGTKSENPMTATCSVNTKCVTIQGPSAYLDVFARSLERIEHCYVQRLSEGPAPPFPAGFKGEARLRIPAYSDYLRQTVENQPNYNAGAPLVSAQLVPFEQG